MVMLLAIFLGQLMIKLRFVQPIPVSPADKKPRGKNSCNSWLSPCFPVFLLPMRPWQSAILCVIRCKAIGNEKCWWCWINNDGLESKVIRNHCSLNDHKNYMLVYIYIYIIYIYIYIILSLTKMILFWKISVISSLIRFFFVVLLFFFKKSGSTKYLSNYLPRKLSPTWFSLKPPTPVFSFFKKMQHFLSLMLMRKLL